MVEEQQNGREEKANVTQGLPLISSVIKELLKGILSWGFVENIKLNDKYTQVSGNTGLQ